MNAAYSPAPRSRRCRGGSRPSRPRGSRRGRPARRTRGRSASRPRTRTRPRRRGPPRTRRPGAASSRISFGSRPSLGSMCTGLVPSTMWIRERRAPASASAAASMSSRVPARTRRRQGRPPLPRRHGRLRNLPGDAAAKPASITSTPRRTSCSAISTFSCGCRTMPGDCSPSRNVVSKTWILRWDTNTSSLVDQSEDAPLLGKGRRLRRQRTRIRVSPLGGENRDNEENRGAEPAARASGSGEMRVCAVVIALSECSNLGGLSSFVRFCGESAGKTEEHH